MYNYDLSTLTGDFTPMNECMDHQRVPRFVGIQTCAGQS